jgi:glycosyltransferase involved in cell wall biosynthesis
MPQHRVLHILKRYRPAFTGEGVFLERSSALMQELAPEVEHHLLVTQTPAPANAQDVAVFSTLPRIFYLLDRPRGTAVAYLAFLWWLLRNLRHYDTVHVRTHADWYFLGYLLCRIMGKRLVLSATLDDSVPVLVNHYRPALRGIARRGLGLFHAYVSISPKLQRETSAVVDPALCHLLSCGITIQPGTPERRAVIRARIGAAPHEPVLLFVGGLCERKDPLSLIEAMPAVRAAAPGARLVLVGPELEPDYVAGLRARIATLGLHDAVLLAGEQLNPHPWFAAADMLAFASRLEGFGTVVPEAMAHGLPVVARRLPGVNDDFVLHGETGFLFDTEAELAEQASRLAAEPDLRARFGAAGRALAEARFDMRVIAAGYLGIYGFPPAAEPRAHPASGLGVGASVLDRRFHAPSAPPPDDTPLLLTMVDAEEAFDWHRPFDRRNTDVSSMAAQALAHRVFERHGVVPTYLTDYPVADQDAGRAPLRELLASGHAELGAQLHPWVTPPFLEEVNERNSYTGNLPTMLELEKARRLTEKLEEAFGTRPRIFRTGRFGVGPRTADVVKALGYEVDSSLVPCWPADNCPDRAAFWQLCARPYWLDRERTVMEIPVSAALVGRLAAQRGLARALFHPGPDRIGLPGLAAHLGLMERIRLSPEGMTIEEAKRLTRAMHAAGHRVFMLTYHSPSLQAGNTPYVRDAAGLERFLAWLDEYYAFFREEIGGRPASWREVRHGRAAAPVLAAAAAE